MLADFPETRLRDLVQAIADLSFDAITITRSTAAQGPEIIFVNDAFTDLTGYPASEVIGQTPGVLQGTETDAAVLERLNATVQRGETFHGKAVNYRKDGTPFQMEWKVTPLGADGETNYYLAVQREAR